MMQPVHNTTPLTGTPQSIPVYCGDMLRVRFGANAGDGLSFLADVELADIYELSTRATRQRLSFVTGPDGRYQITDGTELGQVGGDLHLDSLMTFMPPDGRDSEVLVLVETTPEGTVHQVYFLPLVPLLPEVEYTLVRASREDAPARFAQIGTVSFSRGTRITKANGALIPIEDLSVGDRVLTRDAGPQQIRWIGHSTVRAVGEFAPILIRAGALNNEGDLLVSPDHRLFVYQRSDELGAGQSEILIKARHLQNGDSVLRQDGGFVDYFQILFDSHHIIYAEGIAAESMLLTGNTRSALPPEVQVSLDQILPGHTGSARHGKDIPGAHLERQPDAIELLRRASAR